MDGRGGRALAIVLSLLLVRCSGTPESAEPIPPELLALETPVLLARFHEKPYETPILRALRSTRHLEAARSILLEPYRNPKSSEVERAEALKTAARALGGGVLDVLLEASRDTSDHLRQVAAYNLAGIGIEGGVACRAAALRLLVDPHPAVVEAALAGVGDEPPDPSLLLRVLEIIRNPPKTGPEHRLPQSVYGYDHPETSKLRERAVDAAGKIGSPDALETLLQLLPTAGRTFHWRLIPAIEACAVSARPGPRAGAVEALRPLLLHPDPDNRELAAAAMARLGDPSGVGILIARLEGTSIFSRRLSPVVAALEKLSGQNWGSSDETWDFFEKHQALLERRIQSIRDFARSRGWPLSPPPITVDRLSDADRKALDRIFALGLFDPRGHARVRGTVQVRSCWGGTSEVESGGWLLPATPEYPARVILDGHQEVVAPLNLVRSNFADEVDGELRDKTPGSGANVFWAAWLYRLGDERRAARVLFRAKARMEDLENLVATEERSLAWTEFDQAVNAFIARADEEALTHALRLNEKYPAFADQFGEGKALLADLRRRQNEGTFGKPPRQRPADFDQAPVEKRIETLVRELEDVSARQWGQPGGVEFGGDSCIQALIRIGDAAVPALIDVVENDRRLTRSIHFWRDFAESRTLLTVGEPALTAIMTILKVQFFKTHSTGDSFSARGEAGAKATARMLREYWAKFGSLPLDRRLMKILNDPTANAEAWRDAAETLTRYDKEETLGTTMTVVRVERMPRAPHPLASRFSNPTVAEAILAAMDRDLAAAPSSASTEKIRLHYLDCLVRLRDQRIGLELLKRAREMKSWVGRRGYAAAASDLGNSEELERLAEDFGEGRGGTEGELEETLEVLREAGNPACDRALLAVASPDHPAHRGALELLRKLSALSMSGTLSHPLALRLLRRELENREPDGRRFYIVNDRYFTEEGNGTSYPKVPDYLANPKIRKDEAKGRWCDRAAQRLSQLVYGMPFYDPLYRDADDRIRRMGQMLDRFDGRWRVLNDVEAAALDHPMFFGEVRFVPDLAPLGRAATADDVASGRAVFHLEGKGTSLELRLPAAAKLRTEDPDRPKRVLIVQAEKDSEEKIYYGIVGPNEFRRAGSDELIEIKAIEPPKK